MELEDRLWMQLEAAAEREERRGRLGRSAAVGRAALRGRPMRWGTALTAAAAIAIAAVVIVSTRPDHSAPQWRVQQFGIAGAELGEGAMGFGSIWTYDVSSRHVLRIDPDSHRVVARIGIPGAPTDLALAVGTDAVWAAAALPITHNAPPLPTAPFPLFRIDPGTARVVARVPLRAPGGLMVRPVGVVALPGAVWVWGEAGAVRVDPVSGRVVAGVRPARGERVLGFAATATRLWAATDTPRLWSFDAATGMRSGSVRIPLASFGEKLIVLGDGIVINRENGSIASIDPGTGKPFWVARFGVAPRDLALSGGRLWVLVHDPAAAADELVALDPDTGRTVERIGLGTQDAQSLLPGGPAPSVLTAGGGVLVPKT